MGDTRTEITTDKGGKVKGTVTETDIKGDPIEVRGDDKNTYTRDNKGGWSSSGR